jgi:hypothetical protein
MKGGAQSALCVPILAESGKSREREGSALAVNEGLFLMIPGLSLCASSAGQLQHVPVVQQAIEHGAHGGDIAQQLAPAIDRPIRCQQSAESLVTTHDDLQQILWGRMREFTHPKIVDDQQRHGRAGVKAAQRRGVKFGRKVKLTPEQIDHARKLIDKGEARQYVADLFTVGPSILYRALNSRDNF